MTTTVTVTDTETITEAVNSSCDYISCSDDFGSKIWYPNLYGHTIPSSVTSLGCRTLYSSSDTLVGLIDYMTSAQLTNNHLFLTTMEYSTGKYYLHRIPLNEVAAGVSVDLGEYGWGIGCIYDDYTYYKIIEDNVAEHMILRKYTFTDEVTQPSTSDVYTWEVYETYDSIELSWNVYLSSYCMRLEYGGNVYIAIWNIASGADTPHNYVCKSIIYNVTLDSTVANNVEMFDYDADLTEWYFQHTTPRIHENNIIFGYACMYGWVDWPDPVVDIARFGVAMINITNGNVSLLYGPETTPVEGHWVRTNGGALDYINNKFYFSVHYQDEGHGKVYSVDLTNPVTISEVEDLSASITLERYAQDAGYGYLIDPTGSNNNNMYSYPGLDLVIQPYIDLNPTIGPGVDLVSGIDIDNGMFWSLQLSKLVGDSLIGGSDRELVFDAPFSFTYDGYQWAHMKFLNGKIIVIIFSRTASGPYDVEYYAYLLEQD